jgi:hypothetical protein
MQRQVAIKDTLKDAPITKVKFPFSVVLSDAQLRLVGFTAKSATNLLNPIHTITLCMLKIHFNVISYITV